MQGRHSSFQVRLGFSAGLTVAIAGAFAGAIGCLWLLPVPLAAWAAGAAALGYLAMAQLRAHAWRKGRLDLVVLRRLHTGEWLLGRRNGEQDSSVRLSQVFVHPFIVVLAFRLPDSGRVVTALIARDGVDAEEFRQLRVWLNSNVSPPR